MGTRVSLDSLESAISATPPTDIDWTPLADPSLDDLLCSDYVYRHPNAKSLCAKLLKNPHAVWSLCAAVQSSNLHLSTNLLHSIRLFLAYVFASHQTYEFLYRATKEVRRELPKDDFAFSRQVRCVFQWKETRKTLMISVPQARAFDVHGETAKLVAHVVNSFESLRDHTKATGDFTIFTNEAGDLCNIQQIADYYSQHKPEERIVNPFSTEHIEEQTKPLMLYVRTTECR